MTSSRFVTKKPPRIVHGGSECRQRLGGGSVTSKSSPRIVYGASDCSSVGLRQAVGIVTNKATTDSAWG